MKSEFMINRDGKPYVLYAGLLDEAHQQGLEKISTMVLQFPSTENGNTAVVRAEVEMVDRSVSPSIQRSFTGLGDASPNNVPKHLVTCLLRMAETRAKARALRDAVNIGVTAFEELPGDDSENKPESQSRTAAMPYDRSSNYDNPFQPISEGDVATQKQLGLIYKLQREKGQPQNDASMLTRAQASAEIDRLQSL